MTSTTEDGGMLNLKPHHHRSDSYRRRRPSTGYIKTTNAIKLRSDSSHKWYILAALSTLWIASYHCILCISALQNDMITLFNLSNTKFALFSALSFLSAIFGSLLCPYIIKKLNIYNAMLLSTVAVTFGQFVFIIGIMFSNILIMYLGRIFIGFGYGMQNVTIYSTVNVWFQTNEWLSFALNTVNCTAEIGILTSRFALVPLYQSTNHLFVPYLIGFMLGFLSIISCIIMILIERNFIHSHSLFTNGDEIVLDNDFRKITQFNLNIWLIIIIIIIGWSSCETFDNQLIQPFMVTFDINERNVNILFSVQSIYALTIGPILGWFTSKYGYLSHIVISSMTLMTCGMLLLFINQIIFINIPADISTIIVILIYVIGLQQFYAVSFTCLLLICPLELSSIVNSVAAIGFMIGSAIETWFFGIIADTTNSYKYSVLMMISLTFIGLIIAIIVHCLDIKQNGPLHKHRTYKNTNYNHLTSDEGEQIPLIK